MSVLLLRLAGPLQSWGDSSRFTRRDTRAEPTKSGVLGLLAAAQGRRRTDPIEDLAQMRFGVRVDQPGRLIRDFQTAIRRSDGVSMPLSYRYYLGDAVFVAGVEGDPSLLAALDDAIRHPVYPLYLGRRACPAQGRVSLGVVETELLPALLEHPWEAAMWHRRKQGKSVDLPIVLDAAAVPGTDRAGLPGADPTARDTETIRDIPLSFSPERREYGWRDVTRVWRFGVPNDVGHDRMDFLAALGGA